MDNTVSYLETVLEQKQQQQEEQHHPSDTALFSWTPLHRNNGSVRRRYSSAPRGGGGEPPPLGSVREAGRRRTYGSPAEAEAAAAAAAVWSRYYASGPNPNEDAKTHFSEEEDRSLESSVEEGGGSPWVQGRKGSAWEDGGRRGGAGPVITARNRSTGGPCDGGGGGGRGSGSVIRRLSATTSRLLPSRRASSSSFSSPVPQQQYYPRTPSLAATGDDGSGSNKAAFPVSSTRRGFDGAAVRGSDAVANGPGRCVSSAGVVDVGGDGRMSPPPMNRKIRGVSAPAHAERFAQATRQADIERLLR